MRMWMIDPILLCDRHLLGEHGEIHKFRHNFVKKHSIAGRIFPVVQIEPASMGIRHDQLANEMTRRGMTHNSPYEMPDIGYLPESHRNAVVDRNISKKDIVNRCVNCLRRGK